MKCTFQFPVCNVMMYLLYCKYYFVSYSCTCPNSWRGCCLCQSGEHNKSDLYHQLILCTTSRYYLVPWIKGGSTISIYKQKKIFLARTFKSKQGRPPRESEKEPYAVVDERCESTTQFHSSKDYYSATFTLFFGP